jgi:hypothetical protein
VPAARRPVVRAEELFTELNGCQIGRGDERATVEIYSVSDQAGHRWIQVGLHGATETMFTVEVPSTLGAADVSRTIEAFFGEVSGSDLSQTA